MINKISVCQKCHDSGSFIDYMLLAKECMVKHKRQNKEVLYKSYPNIETNQAFK